MQTSASQVLIIGAGPTGLVLAIWLRKKGIRVRIVDKSARPGTTSRALAVQARTLEFYRQLGIADELTRRGIRVPEIRMRRLGKVIARARIGEIGAGMTAFPYLLFCAQDVHEEMLCGLLEGLGMRVERSTEVVGLSQDASAVTATLKTPHGSETTSFEFVCGCDGAHSFVRQTLQIGFPGGTYSQLFYVADVLAKGEAASGGLQISISSKDFCIVMPVQTRGTLRLTGIVPPENETQAQVQFSDVEPSVRRNTGLEVTQVNWFSTYHVHHRVAQVFRRGRVFLSGDAGHIHSPAGGQGMNTGIGDAVNLAWKLAEVLHGRASTKILDSYEPERIAFARTLVQTTDTAFKVIASRSLVGSLFRAYVLPGLFAALTRMDFFIRFVFRTISQTRIRYRKSELSKTIGHIDPKKACAGDRLPWVRFGNGDNHAVLSSMAWQVHVYGSVDERFERDLKSLGIELYRFEGVKEAIEKGLSPHAAYLIRPDGYIGMVLATPDARKISDYLASL